MKEVSILSQLDQKHDNIIKLYGISIHEDTMQMVCPQMLHRYLCE